MKPVDASDVVLAPDFARRFGGLSRLYGEDGLARLRAARVCVVGVGGVGSWAVEALARSGVGALRLVDMDHIAESNANRQLHALDPDWGMAKVEAMARRVRAINPACVVEAVDDFITADAPGALLGEPDWVLDAIDGVREKTALAAWCAARGQALVVCGAAGGQIDPTRIEVADLAHTLQDPLLAKMRAKLRKEHGFSRDAKQRFGIAAVFSTEALRYPASSCAPANAPQGLNCAGFGSSVVVTASFGLTAAGVVINAIVGEGRR